MSGWPDTVKALVVSLRAAGVSPIGIERLTHLARPAFMLASAPMTETDIPIGATKLGGRPDLPPGMPWPERPAYANGDEMAREALDGAERFHADAGLTPPWMDQREGAALIARSAQEKAETRAFMKSLGVENADLDEAFSIRFSAQDARIVAREAEAKAEAAQIPFPLAFIGQIDLAALSRMDGFDHALPRTGRLYLFYDLLLLPPSYAPTSGGGLRVIHDTAPTDTLVRANLPQQLEDIAEIKGAAMTPARIVVRLVITPPTIQMIAALDLTSDDRSAYQDWLAESAGWPRHGEAGAHQLVGWPREIQGNMAGVAELAANGIDAGTSEAWQSPAAQSLLADADAWRLLFQLGPDEPIGNMLPGALNILTRAEDLTAGRFDRAWAVYEQS